MVAQGSKLVVQLLRFPASQTGEGVEVRVKIPPSQLGELLDFPVQIVLFSDAQFKKSSCDLISPVGTGFGHPLPCLK